MDETGGAREPGGHRRLVSDEERFDRVLASRVELLPDSRLQHREKGVVRGPWGNWIPIFCANCGAEGGFVPEDQCTFAFWLCNDCYAHHGEIAGMMMMPDEVFFAELAARRAENADSKGGR